MPKKNTTTIEDLAVMMRKGFQEIDHKMATKAEMQKGFQEMEQKMATKAEMQKGFQEMEHKMATKEMVNGLVDDFAVMVQKGFQGVDKRLDGVDVRLDKIEHRLGNVEDRLDGIERIFSVDHKHRIERLEFEVKNLKDLFALK